MTQDSCYPAYDSGLFYTPSGDLVSSDGSNYVSQNGIFVLQNTCSASLPTKCFPSAWTGTPDSPYQLGSEVNYNGQNWILTRSNWKGFGACSVALNPVPTPGPQPQNNFCYPLYSTSSDHQYFEGSVTSTADGTNWMVRNNAWIQTGSCSVSKMLCYPTDYIQKSWPVGAQVNAGSRNFMLLTTGWTDQGSCIGKGTTTTTSTTTTTTKSFGTTTTTSTSVKTFSSKSSTTAKASTATSSTMSRTTTAVACPTMIIRKDYRDLNDAEKQRFVNAIQELRRRPSTQGQRSLYDDFTFIHAQFLDQIHGQPMFAPWHREMMRRFEAALHSIDSSVTLPYYDWAFNGQNPLVDTAIFGKGPTGFGTNGGCVKDGFVAGWTDNDGQCLQRQYDAKRMVFPDNTQLAQFVINSPNFVSFETQLETQHNNVHVQIGGSGGDMSFVNRSPNDPLFYMHHANIDRLWYRWQKNHPSLANTYDPKASLNDVMPGFDGLPVRSAMISDNGAGNGIWCIQYQPYSGSGDVLASGGNRRRDDVSIQVNVDVKVNLTPAGKEKLLDMIVSKPVGTHKSLEARKPVPPIPDEAIDKMANDPKMIEMMRIRVRQAEKEFYAATDKLDNDVAAYLDANSGASHTEALFHVTKDWVWDDSI